MGILNEISGRWSPVAFSSDEVTQDMMELLFEAARWAPSAFNEQPWRFCWAARKDGALFRKFLDALVPGNREWAQHAPVLVLVMARKNFTYNNKENPTALYDTGMAVGNLLAQATGLGLVAHQMSGFSAEKARENLEIPDDTDPIAMMALGHHGDPATLPAALREREMRERTRKPLDQLVAYGKAPEN